MSPPAWCVMNGGHGSPLLNPAGAGALVVPQFELTALLWRREVNHREGFERAVDVDITPATQVTGRRVERYRILPGDRIGSDVSPFGIGVIRASDAGRARRARVAVSLQPGQAVVAGHARLDERPAARDALVAARLHPRRLVERYTEPLNSLGGPLLLEQGDNLALDWPDLVIPSALALE